MKMMKNKLLKNAALAAVGGFLLLTGITLVLLWWDAVAVVFRGVAGGLLAVLGLFILFFIKE